MLLMGGGARLGVVSGTWCLKEAALSWYEKYRVSIPEGESGDWKVERFCVSPQDAEMERLRSMFSSSSRGRGVPEGTYTRLTRRGWVVMSDTPDEIRDHLGPIREVIRAVRRDEKPTCLVHGLGLGMVAAAMLDEGAASVTVVERSPDVIALVGPTLMERYGKRIEIVEADALTWKPSKGAKWDVVWHDIWESICRDNLGDMKALHRRFGRRSKWQGSWSREILR